MIQLAVLSGKGGTGKTTVTGALIDLAAEAHFADCDVDAPNLHLIHPIEEELKRKPFYGMKKAQIFVDLCTQCGLCEENCRFDAIQNGVVNPMLCEGCGVCTVMCPVNKAKGANAVEMVEILAGESWLGLSENRYFSTAELKMGNGTSGKLVSEVRKSVYSAVGKEDFVLIDGPPGIGCPVIATLTGVSAALLVTEPTESGLHDIERIVATAKHFKIPCAVCINRYDQNLEKVKAIEELLKKLEVLVVGKIPYDPQVVQAVNQGKAISAYPESASYQAIKAMWDNLKPFIEMATQRP